MAAPKLSAREIVAYSDAELDRYLEENGRIVSVQDPRNLPESFIQRLRDRVISALSRPVDPDQVSARLLQIPPDGRTPLERPAYSPSESSSAYRTPDPEEERAQDVASEREFQHNLVKDGGRPCYDINLVEEVSKNPQEYRQLLGPWRICGDGPEGGWRVFGLQLVRWILFREWQVKRRKEFEGCISRYTKRARKLLLKYSFTRPFEFNEDPKRQDKLTTWIEYLTYECDFYDMRYAWYERRKKWYDRQWKKLMDSGVLRPHETKEFILDPDAAFYDEIDHCKEAVESARLAVSSERQIIHGPSQPSPASQGKLEAAQAKLDSANRSWESIKRRHDLINKFLDVTLGYRESKKYGERHTVVLQWIREQVPLIELELEQAKDAGGSSDAGPGSSSAGLKRERTGEAGEEQKAKRQMRHGEEPPLLTQGTATAPQEGTRKRSHGDISADDGSPSKRSKHDAHDSVGGSQGSGIPAAGKEDGEDKATLQTSMLPEARSADVCQSSATIQPRRSARIAARKESSKISFPPPPRAVKDLRQNSRQSNAQAPTPASSTGSQHRSSRSGATKAVDRTGTKRGGQRKVSQRKVSKRKVISKDMANDS